MKDLKLKIRLTADNSGLTGKVKVSRAELDHFSRSARGVGGAAQVGSKGVQAMNTAMMQGRDGASLYATTIARAHSYLLGYLSLQGAGALIGMAEEYKMVNARLRNATDSQRDFNTAQAQTIDIAMRTGQSLDSIAGLYGKLRLNAGFAAEESARLTEILAQATQLDGGGQGAQAALFQLQQGLASGTLRGEELNSVLEQTPTLALAIARGLDMPIGKLRDFAAEGNLTAEAVKQALFNQQQAIAQMYDNLPLTMGRAMENLRTAALQEIGLIDEGLGATGALAESVDALAQNLGGVLGVAATTAGGLASIMAGRLTPSIISATQAQLGKVQATVAGVRAGQVAAQQAVAGAQAEVTRTTALLAEAQAEKAAATATRLRGAALTNINVRVQQATVAQAAATTALSVAQANAARQAGLLATAGRGLLAAVGGVPGLIVGGVVSLGMWAMSSRDAADATGDWRDSIDLLTGSMDTLRAKQLTTEIDAMTARIAEQERVVLGLHEQLRIDPYASVKGTRIHAQTTDNLMAQQQELDDMRAAMERLRAAMAGLKGEASTGTVTPDVDVSAVQDYLDKMRERIALVGQSELSVAQYRASAELEAAASKAAADGNTALAQAYRDAIPQAQALAAQLHTKEQATRASAQADAEAAREQAQFEQSLGQLMARLDPVAAATEAYMTNVALLDRAWLEGLISGEAHLALMQQLASGQTTAAEMAAQLATEYDALLSAIDPLHAKFVEMADLEFKAWELFDKGQIKDMNELAAVLEKIRKKGQDVGNDVGGGMTTAADMADTFASAVKDSATSMREMYAEGSSAYTGLTILIQAMNVVQGIAAVVKQYAEGDPYTAFARGAAMIASVAALGISVGGSGSSGPSGSRGLSSNFGSRDGGMIGGGESESVSGALEAIADNTGDLVAINRGMLTALRALSGDLSGMSNQIARTFGETTITAMSDSKWVLSAGLEVGGTFSDAQVGGWGRSIDISDKYYTINDQQFALDAATAGSIITALGNMRTGVLEGAATLGMDTGAVGRAIDAAQIAPVKLRLDNKDPEEQAEAIAAAFDGVFDHLVAQTLPELQQFQIVGEGLGETLARVSTAVDLSREAVRALGLQMRVTATEDMMAASVRMTELMGGADEYANAISSFTDAFLSETEQLAATGGQLHQAFRAMNDALPRTREEYVSLMQAQDMATEAGAQQVAQLLKLQDAADDYYSQLDDRVRDTVAGSTAVYEAYRQQRLEIDSLIAAYDGSTWSMDALNDAYAIQQDLAYVLGAAWQQVGQRAQDMLGNLAEQIRQDLMGEQELYDYRRAQAHTLADALQTMTDPAQVAATVEEIERLTGQMWQSLAADQREAMGQEFLSFLDGVDAQVQQRMGDAMAGLDAEGDGIAQAIDQAMSEAANRLADSSRQFNESTSLFQDAVESMTQVVSVMQSAASTMQAAANTPVRVSVTQPFSEVG